MVIGLPGGVFGLGAKRALGVHLDGDRVRIVLGREVGATAEVQRILDTDISKAKRGGRGVFDQHMTRPPAIIAVPQRYVMVRFANLPSDDPLELREMAMLEAIRLIPFSQNEALVGSSFLRPLPGGYGRVAMFVVRRADLQSIEQSLKPLNLNIAGYCPTGLLFSRWVGRQKSTGWVIGVLRETVNTTLVVLKDGIPAALRGFAALESDPETLGARLAREVQKTLDGLNPEGETPAALLVASTREEPKFWMRALEKALGRVVELVEPPMEAGTWIAEESSRTALMEGDGIIESETPAPRSVWPRWAPSAGLAAALLLTGVLWWSGEALRLVREERYWARRWAPMAKEVETLETLARQTRKYSKTVDPTRDWPNTVAVLNVAIPGRVYLTEMIYDKRHGLELRGRAPAVEDAVAALAALEMSGRFKAVELRSSVARSDGGIDFQIGCSFRGGV